MADIEAGLPDIKKEKKTTTREIKFSEMVGTQDWKCKTCMNDMAHDKMRCNMCGAMRVMPKDPYYVPGARLAAPKNIVKKPVKRPAQG